MPTASSASITTIAVLTGPYSQARREAWSQKEAGGHHTNREAVTASKCLILFEAMMPRFSALQRCVAALRLVGHEDAVGMEVEPDLVDHSAGRAWPKPGSRCRSSCSTPGQRRRLLRTAPGDRRVRPPMWRQTPFAAAEQNLHRAARDGLTARLRESPPLHPARRRG